MRPDVLVIHPASRRQVFGSLTDFDLPAVEPPLWAALLAAYLRERGFAVELLDAEAAGFSPEDVGKAAAELKPLLALVVVSGTNPSASTVTMPSAGETARAVSRETSGTATALLGLHPSALPERTLREEGVDYVIQGEGFFTLPALLQALKAGERSPAVDGLWSLRDGAAVMNPRPRPLADLDSLPMPAWDLLPMKAYRAHNWHRFDDLSAVSPYTVLYTSLGCPFSCSFCCVNALAGRSGIRYRGVESVTRELAWLAEHTGVRKVKILDEMFALSEERVEKLCGAIAGLGLELDMWAYARVSTVTPRMLDSMRAAGITWAAYGFESAAEGVLEASSKGYKAEDAFRVSEMTRAAGMRVLANYVFGLPGDDYDAMQHSLAVMQELNAPWANIYAAMAYPGSKLHEEAVRQGWPLPGSWRGYSQYDVESLPLPTASLTGGQVLAFRDYAFEAYYRNPRYLDMIRATFGADTAAHILGMTGRRINRKYAEAYAGAGGC